MELKQKIETLLLQEKKRFPLAQIQDYYKIIFQSVFGAGHLIKDTASTIDYLTEEWNRIDSDKEIELTHDISLNIPMVRLNLQRCKAENISLQKISEMFIEGCQSFINPWQNNFAEILTLTKEIITLAPFGFNKEDIKEKLPGDLQTDFPVMHHSTIYRKLYNPHYRIIPLKYLKLGFLYLFK